jgi:hypothetical protein
MSVCLPCLPQATAAVTIHTAQACDPKRSYHILPAANVGNYMYFNNRGFLGKRAVENLLCEGFDRRSAVHGACRLYPDEDASLCVGGNRCKNGVGECSG